MLFIPIVLFCFISILNAEYRLNFFVGDVLVEVNGKSLNPRMGMPIPESASIITGTRSQAHIYDTARGVVVSIRSDEKVSIESITSAKSGSRYSLWDRMKKENHSTGITTSAGVRGAEEGKEEMEWDDNSNSAPISVGRDRTTEWKFFNERHYSKIVPLTVAASDIDGIFLHAASTYYVHGNSSADQVTSPLEKVITEVVGSGIKTESYRILAAIYFERARFDRSWDYMTAAAKCLPEREIGESGYFILTQSAFYTNRSDEGREYLRKMKKHHGRSPLLEKIVER